jgi:hypothetical protein
MLHDDPLRYRLPGRSTFWESKRIPQKRHESEVLISRKRREDFRLRKHQPVNILWCFREVVFATICASRIWRDEVAFFTGKDIPINATRINEPGWYRMVGTDMIWILGSAGKSSMFGRTATVVIGRISWWIFLFLIYFLGDRLIYRSALSRFIWMSEIFPTLRRVWNIFQTLSWMITFPLRIFMFLN